MKTTKLPIESMSSSPIRDGHFRRVAGLLLVLGLGWIANAPAQLPALNKSPWQGYFAGYENKRFTFGLASGGEIRVTPLNDKGEEFGPNHHFAILFGIEEILPDGRLEMKKIKPETLTSEQAATDKLERVVIRGKVSADAAFEAVFAQDRGVISMTGRVMETGGFKKNPIRFGVQVRFPDTYPKWMREDRWKSDEKAMAALQKQMKAEIIRITWTDGTKVTHSFEAPVDAASKTLNGPGMSKAEIEVAAFKNRRFVFSAPPSTPMTLSNAGSAPLSDGFSIHWSPDAEAKSAFSLEIK